MRSRLSRGIPYYQFDALAEGEVVHAIFTRHGGVSTGPFASLNMSISTGDQRDHVRLNRHRAFRALDRAPESIADLWQVHSAEVVVVDERPGDQAAAPKADALLTDNPAVTLFMRFADCVPILLHDPQRKVVGLVHAGWRGTLAQVAAAAVRAMTDRFGSRPESLFAGIGPSIGPCHYAVGPEVADRARAVFGSQAEAMLERVNGGEHLDLWAANEQTLRAVGVQQVERGGLCTACRTDEFFSHRGEAGRTGRFGALIALR